MKFTFLSMGAALALCAFAVPADAQPVSRTGAPTSVIASTVTVPPGYTTYYISGTPSGPMNPDEVKNGAAPKWGNTTWQTNDSLTKLEATLKTLGLTFADVVKATVFLVKAPDGQLHFADMNAEFKKRFGSSGQPNKPARSTVEVTLATPGALVEIELIAVKKVQ
jgi:enamine deaminase RidA (YjgF/YER057c/UK114 family)